MLSKKEFSQLTLEHKQLAAKLSQPETFKEPQASAQLLKRQAFLSDILQDWQTHQKITQRLKEAAEFLGEADLAEAAKEEIAKLELKQTELESKINRKLGSIYPNDERDAILEIRAGTGGEEAALFAADLFKMYSRFIESLGWTINLLNSSRNDLGGLKEIIFEVKASSAYGCLKNESGVHRVQRIPVTEKNGRIHTSTASVVVLPIIPEQEINLKADDLRIDVFRSSGPGGQSVNTTDSAVRITHLPSGLIVSCQDERSQHKNKAKALKILAARLTDLEASKRQTEARSLRKNQIGSGDRNEKIRTYNFPQNRLTDHRLKKSWHNLEQIMAGNLEPIVEAFKN